MKLEMEGREPLIVLFGLPIVTTAIVLGSMYLGRMQAEVNPAPSVHVEPNVTVTPRITAEIPQGAIRYEIQVPPAQIHEVVREVRVPEVNIVNKVEPTPVQVVMPKHTGTEPQVIIVPTPLPLPMNGAWAAANQLPVSKAVETSNPSPKPEPSKEPPIKTAATGTSETVQVTSPVPPPPEPIKPTPVSTDARSDLVEPDVEGKLLPPPRNLNGQPETK